MFRFDICTKLLLWLEFCVSSKFHRGILYVPSMRPVSTAQLRNYHRDKYRTVTVRPFDESHRIVGSAFSASTSFYYSHVVDHITAPKKTNKQNHKRQVIRMVWMINIHRHTNNIETYDMYSKYCESFWINLSCLTVRRATPTFSTNESAL